MSTPTVIEMQTRLHRLERQNRVLILLLLAFGGIGSIAATNRPSRIAADEIRTSQLIIVDNHGKVLTETHGVRWLVKGALKASPARYAGAIRTKRNTSILSTPSIRVPGFEDEDEYESPHEWHPMLGTVVE